MQLSVLSFFVHAATAAPVPAAEAVVRGIYAPYLRPVEDGLESIPPVDDHPALSQSLRALWQAEHRVVPVQYGPETMGCDPFIDGQDWNMKRVELRSEATPGGATVVATFLAGTADTTVTYQLIQEGKAWRVDDITGTEQGSVRGLLTAAFEDRVARANPTDRLPSPVPAAEAAVRAFYAAGSSPTAGATPSRPVSTRGLSWSLRARVRDGSQSADFLSRPPAPVALTLRSAANPGGATVWATVQRFGAAETLLYQLIREDGAWRIDGVDDAAQAGLPHTLAALANYDLEEQALLAEVEEEVWIALKPYMGPTPNPPPLHRSPFTSRALRAQLEAAGSARVEAGAPVLATPADPIERAFLPIRSLDLRVRRTAAGVFVEMQSAPGLTVLSARMVLEDGRWRIDDLIETDGTSLRGQAAAQP